MPSKRKEQQLNVQSARTDLKSQTDDSTAVGNHSQRKKSEKNVAQLSLKLEQTQIQESGNPKKSIKSSNTTKMDDDEESEEVEDEEDEEEEDEDEDDEPAEDHPTIKDFISISDFDAEQAGDLSFKKGTPLTILEKRSDGWWLAENIKGERGLVPKTYLQVHKRNESLQESVSEEDEEDDDEETEDTEAEKKVKPHWKMVKQAVTQQLNATDVLTTMGAIPAGFRPSTLAHLLGGGKEFHSSYCLQPEFSQSHLAFKDLLWDPEKGTIRARPTRVMLLLILWSCKNIPLPGTSIDVLSRHVRFCVFDGSKVLSNIHTVRAAWNQKNPKMWSFSPRITGILPSLLDGDCFVRSDSQSSDIGILFELGITYIRKSTRGRLPCGWCILSLLDTSGVCLFAYKTYELSLNGGTPYEKGVDVDPTLTRRTGSNVFQQMMSSRRQPRLMFKVKSLPPGTRDLLNLLPDTLIGSSSCIHLLAFYRQILADALLRDRISMQNADLICNPVLATFPKLMEQTDVMDALRSAWAEKENTFKRSEKRDNEFLKSQFILVYHDSAYPLLCSTSLPPAKWADDETDISRWKFIAAFLEKTREKNSALSALLSAENIYEAFDISDVSYDFLRLGRSASVPV
ncbi:nephrocystin-1 [Protopterus annectens]|uniref:nephrocystin-1 n=1 Tax=Protopterus annectens TaxID=7888 RepID=UPI001CF93D8E|nr:nephrocystin-1 [Protopterus annectens]